MFRFKSIAKASLLLLTMNCFSQADAATVLPITEMGSLSNQIVIAVDNNNNAISLFDNNDLMEGAYSPANQTWIFNGVISNNIPDKFDPAVAIDATGKGLGIWSGYDGNTNTSTIETRTYNSGAWINPVTLETLAGSGLITSSVSMNGSGNGLAAWVNQDISEVHGSFYNGLTSTWSPYEFIGNNVGREVEVAYSPNGDAAAAWSHFDLGISEMWGVGYDGGTSSWDAQVLLDNLANTYPSIGIDANGNAIVLWGGNNLEIHASRFDGSTWSPYVTLSASNNNDDDPRIAVDLDGTAIAVWADSSGNIQMARFNGTAWVLPSTTIAAGVTATITMDSLGNALIGWLTADNKIFIANLPKGGVLGDPVLVSENVTNLSSFNLALSSGSSTGIVAWNEGSGEFSGTSFSTFVLFESSAPTGITGSTCTIKFATQSDRVNIINWGPSLDPLTVAYYVYRNGVLIEIVPATGPFTFVDHNRCVIDTYAVTAVNGQGSQSAPVTITLP